MICLQVLHPLKNYSSQVSFETYLHCYKITSENKSFSTSAFKYLFVNKKSAHQRITSLLFVFLKKKKEQETIMFQVFLYILIVKKYQEMLDFVPTPSL